MGKHLRFLVIMALLLAPVFGLATATPAHVSAQATSVTVVAHAVDGKGNPLSGACYGIASQRTSIITNEIFCDGADDADDGATTLANVHTAPDYVLTMVKASAGYIVGQSQPLTGTQTDFTFVVQKGGSAVEVSLKDQGGKPVAGGCLFLEPLSSLGGSGGQALSYFCAAKHSKGVVRVDGVPPGEYRVRFGQQPDNFAAVESEQRIQVKKGQTAKTSFSFLPAGSVSLIILNPDGTPVATGGCWALKSTKEAIFVSTLVCGPDQTGAFTGQHIPVGSYELDSFFGGLPRGLTLPKKQVTFTVTHAKTAKATITLASGGQGIVVSTLDPDGQPVNGSCISVFSSKSSKPYRQAGYACSKSDELQNATTTLWGIAPGDYFVQVTQFGQSQFASPPLQKVKVKAGKEADVTVQAVAGSTLVVILRDSKRKPVVGGCVSATTDIGGPYAQYSRLSCDADDGTKDGAVTFAPVPSGAKIYVLATLLPDGWSFPISQSVSADAGVTSTVKMTLSHGGSLLTIHRVNQAGAALKGSCFLIFTAKNDKPADLVTNGCDTFDGSNDGVTQVALLVAGNYIARESYVGDGSKPSSGVPFTIVKGQDLDLTIPATAKPAASPAASPVTSPVASPVASPAASPIASPTASK